MMQVKEIKLDNSMPSKVTIEMTALELAQITKWLGGLNGFNTPKGLERFYFEATYDFFNKFWDGGVNDCLKGQDI